MLPLASSNNGSHKYVLFERPREVQYLSLEGLGYFEKALGMGDYLKSFQGWIERQDSTFLGCIDDNSLIGWCMFEQWEKWDQDRTPIFVLRTIEVRTSDRGKKVGLNLVRLMALVVPGHIVTRPLSINAKDFFEHIGFISPPQDVQIDFRDKYGYLLLPSVVKRELANNLIDEQFIPDESSIVRYCGYLKTHVLREELSQLGSFAQAFTTMLAAAKRENGGEKTFIKTDTSKMTCGCGSTAIDFYSIISGEHEHLGVECHRCGQVWLTVPI